LGGFFFKLEAMGANVLVEFKMFFLIWGIFFNWGHFFKLGAMGANVLAEFENVFFNWGHFFTIGGIFFKLVAKNYFGIQKISYFGNYMDPCI